MRLIISSIWVVLVCFQTFQVNAQDFITQWTFSSAATQIRFNALTSGAVNYTWNASPSGNSGSGSFTMTSPGGVALSGLNIPANSVVTLNISPSNLRRFYINNGPDRTILTKVTQWGAVPWSSMANAFNGCINLIVTANDIPILTNTTDISQMFYNASSFNQPIGNWNTSNVTNMNGVFAFATIFNQDVSDWNTSNVIDMGLMFQNAQSFNQDLSGWNTSNVTSMVRMFLNAYSFNQNVGNWNTSNVTNMLSMFENAFSFNQDIGNWNTANVSFMRQMFSQAFAFNQNLGNWILRSNVNFPFIFNSSGMDCDHYTATLIGWQTNNPTVTGRALGAQGRSYGTSAVSARNALINNQGWSITGDSPSGATCDALLPIELISFNVTSINKNVNLHWQTSSEINNHYFDIEYSTDGTDFTAIGRKEGAGNSNTLLDYNFVHKDVSAGIHYYRLKQVDYDGKYSYSDIKSAVVKGEGNDVTIYPNPSTNIINVNGANGLYYTLYDLVGRQVSDGQISDDVISIDQLSTGMYYLHFDSNAGKSVYKIWKE